MRLYSLRVLAALAAAMGVDEILLLTALVLVVTGLWPLVGRSALLIPGLTLLWIALPQRAPFVARSSESEKSARRST
jgi:hypothetical protein